MRLVSVENLQPGMISAQDIFPETEAFSIPLVRKDETINRMIIDNLSRIGIRFAYVQDKAAGGGGSAAPVRQIYVAKEKPIITPALRGEAIDSLQELFSSASAFGTEDVHVSSVQIIKHLDTVVEQLVDSLQNDRRALVNITDLKSYDEYTYHHSLSVAVLSIAIAQYMGMSRADLKQIGTCSMMHDIGKTAVPIEVIHKTTRLDDEEFTLVKNHSPAGYDYLVRTAMGNDDIRRAVLCHHEKYDGTGYPNGIKGTEIPLMSRVISVADVYDALTSNRPYRTPMQPAEAIEYIMGGAGSAFDHDVASAFVRKVDLYPVGSTILLSDGNTAVVLNNESQMRPVVRTVETGQIMDLYRDRQCLSIVVTKLLPDDAVASPVIQ